ncbi:MAG: glycosyltransferase [Alphaproteobacteria bacterium]
MTQRLVSIHCFDPRGAKVGGMETHVRQLIRRHPADMRILMVGLDDFGDLEIGKLHTITVAGREIDFVPVLHIPADSQTTAAKTVSNSVTFRFAKALARHLPKIRRMIRGEAAAAEVERFEFAPLARMLGCPLVVMAHNEGDPKTDKMDSVLSRHWRINAAAEWLAFRLAKRIFCVTPRIRDRLAERYPSQAKKAEVLTVSVDTDLFHATPFDLSSGKLKLVYAGRLDEFKDPALMFRVARRLHEALNGQFEFHFCGSADPHRFPEFAAIEAYTVRHGALLPEGVAAVMRQVHMGILVSHWEGMPCFLLELLASGRPFGGLRLPQFDQVIAEGVNGRMVERGATVEESEAVVAGAILQQWADIRAGKVDPQKVHEKIVPWSVDNQLTRLFTALREIARPGKPPPAPARVAAPAE